MIKHTDQPKETAYRMIEWSWTEWHGQDRIERTDWCDVPYERYPQTFDPPPGVELSIAKANDGSKVVIAPSLTIGTTPTREVLHVINLFLELFGECHLFLEGLTKITKPRRLNWEVLPKGKMPWPKLRAKIQPFVSGESETKQKLILNRFDTINAHEPTFMAVGRAGFAGYVIFGFPKKKLYVLESAYTWNATYVFREDWEQLSKLTKAEILSEGLNHKRCVHLRGWHQQIDGLLGSQSDD